MNEPVSLDESTTWQRIKRPVSEGFAYFRWHCLRWPAPEWRACRGACDNHWMGWLYWNGSNWLMGHR